MKNFKDALLYLFDEKLILFSLFREYACTRQFPVRGIRLEGRGVNGIQEFRKGRPFRRDCNIPIGNRKQFYIFSSFKIHFRPRVFASIRNDIYLIFIHVYWRLHHRRERKAEGLDDWWSYRSHLFRDHIPVPVPGI